MSLNGGMSMIELNKLSTGYSRDKPLLKDQYLKEGKSVLMTTSTHMKIEENTLVDPSYEEIINEIKKIDYITSASIENNKYVLHLEYSTDVIKNEEDIKKYSSD